MEIRLRIVVHNVPVPSMKMCRQIVADVEAFCLVGRNSTRDDPMRPQHADVEYSGNDISGNVRTCLVEFADSEVGQPLSVEARDVGLQE